MKRGLAALGVLAFAIAVAAAVGGVGESAAWVRAVTFVGAGAAVVAGAWLAFRLTPDRRESLPAVETAVGSDPPGRRLDEALGSLVGRGVVDLTPRGVRDALRRAARAVIASREGLDPSGVDERLDDGSWTDDAVAARFIAADWSLPPTSVGDRVRRAFGRGPDRPLTAAARHAADAVAARAGIDGPRDAPAAEWFPPRAGSGATAHTVTGAALEDEVEDDADAAVAENDAKAADAEDAEAADTDTVLRSRARTRRFRWVGAYALLALGAGVIAQAPATAFAAAPAVAYVAWARLAETPEPAIDVSREIADESPEAGATIQVRTTITNTGTATLPDCRLVDGVPAALSVVDGSPRAHCRLAPGETVEIAYAVHARRGVHSFAAALAVVRDAPGAVESRYVMRAPDEITCEPPLASVETTVPLREGTSAYAGRVAVDDGGAGLEFFQTREYRHGDPLSRVDWHRLARTGDLATTEFRRERAATVVLVVDARAAGYVAPDPAGPHALDRAVDAAGALASALLADGNRVGLGAVSTTDCWIPPGAGDGHRERLRRALGTHAALSPVPADRNLRVKRSVDDLRARIPKGAQVFFLTPLCDDRATRIARRFEAGGRAVTVLSPDPTLARTPSHRLARVGRRLRVTGLRQRDVRVVDWGWAEPLAIALSRAQARGDVR